MSKERLWSIVKGAAYAAALAAVGYLAKELGLDIPPLNVIGDAVRTINGNG